MCSTHCDSAFMTLKDELCKMPMLQYPNPNKPCKLFTDASKYSYSGILHHEKEAKPDTLIPMHIFRQISKNTATLEYNKKSMLHSLRIHTKVFIFSNRS